MIVEIDEKGQMIIKPQNRLESEKLWQWYKKNSTEICRKVIEFKGNVNTFK